MFLYVFFYLEVTYKLFVYNTFIKVSFTKSLMGIEHFKQLGFVSQV